MPKEQNNKEQEKNRESESSASEVLMDFAKDAVGYDKGFMKTLIDLRARPVDVVNGYLSKSSEYVSPFKIVFSIATVWIIVMNFIFDWEQIGRDVFLQISTLLDSLENVNASTLMEDPEFIEMQSDYAKFFADLFSKYLIVFAIVIIPLNAWLSLKFCKKFGISFQRHVTITAYQIGLKLLPGFIFVLGISIDYLITMGVFIIIIILGAFGWKPAGYLTSPVPIRRFFEENGEAIEKKYNQAGLVIIVLCIVVGGFAGFILGLLD